ncbi:MAG: phytanoyl-CoA dioxygenase family protein [Methylacidiphilales bacterium]|nr:phytanoyl-CoA dioxygenase family protein [Candidatus Methylacidiphilales bacterium]
MTTVQASPTITSQQVQAYRDDGFIVIDDFLSPEEVETLREAEASPAIQTTLEEMGIKSRTVHLLEITTRHPAFLELARDPRVMDCIRPLLGEDIQLQHSKLATKPSTRGTGAFGWHQDLLYYPHTNTSLLSVFVYLDDATPENGCMSMVRGSQRLGQLNHHDAKGVFVGACSESQYWEGQPDKVVAVTPRAGSISIHHCLTLHGSPPNLSGRPRRGLVFSYRADDAYQLGDNIFRDTGLVVSGKRKGIVRCESASWSLPLRPNTVKKDYGNAYHQTGEWAEAINDKAGV